MIYDSILGTIGKTPVVRIQRLAPKHVPYTGERYLTTMLFEGIAAGSDPEP